MYLSIYLSFSLYKTKTIFIEYISAIYLSFYIYKTKTIFTENISATAFINSFFYINKSFFSYVTF